jgi:hypothetical protein
MELTVAQKNELANRLVAAQQSGNYGSFNDLVRQLGVTQNDLLQNFPAINQAGINEQISLGAAVPTKAPTRTTYTQDQIAAAIRNSLAAGYTVQQAKMGAMTNFGLSEGAFNAALDQVQASPSAFSDSRVAQAIRDSLAQGFTIDQARQGAMANFGVGQSQFDRAMQLIDRASMQYRGSAPTYQFPGLLADREQMPTGAQRFISRTPSSLLYDVPRVQNAEFVFQPGAFDYEAIRNQQAGTVDQVEGGNMPSTKISPASVTPTTTPVVKPTVTTPSVSSTGTTTGLLSTSPTYSNQQVAQAIIDSLQQGYTLDQIQGGALRNFGVGADQFNQATQLLPSLGYTVGKGFA